MAQSSLCRIDTEAQSFYICHTPYVDSGFHVTLTDCSRAWSVSVTKTELEQMTRRLRMSSESFLSDTQRALCHGTAPGDSGAMAADRAVGAGAQAFEYFVQISKDGREAVLTLKKYVANEDIRVQLGSFKLAAESGPSDVLRRVLDATIAAASQQNEVLGALRTDNERLATDRAAALKRLEKAVSAKEEMESELYSKFVIVLNEKKRKLRELRDGGGEDTVESETARNGSVKRPGVREDSEEERSRDLDLPSLESDYETDEEPPRPSPSRPGPSRGGRGDPGASTSSNNRGRGAGRRGRGAEPESSDTSAGDLVLHGVEEASPPPVMPVATRRRRGGTVKKQTPSRPVIPKVSSTELKKTPSTSRPSLFRKTSSRKSASSDPDIDDLLNAGFD